MENCSYCGEYKKVRFEQTLSTLNFSYGWVANQIISGKYVCEDCNKALKIKREKELLDNKKLLKEKQKKWIKERNKLLKENETI